MLPERSTSISIYETETGIIIYNRVTKKSYKLGEDEYSVFQQLDGHVTIAEISQKTKFSIESIAKIINTFESYQLLKSSRIVIDKSAKRKHALMYNTSLLQLFVCPFSKWLSNVFSIISLPMLILSIIFMRGRIDVDNFIESVNIFHILIMDVFLAISVGMHEISHGFSAVINGAICAEIGYKWDFLVPSAYTTLCGVDAVKSKWQRIQIFFSGISLNAMLATISLLVMSVPCFNENIFVFMIFSCNLCLILINCITLLESDVYYMLCYLFDDMELKKHTIEMLRGKSCINVGNVIYFVITFVAEPIALTMLIVTAMGKIGGSLL